MRKDIMRKLVFLVAAASLTLAGCGGGSSSGTPAAQPTLDTGLTLAPVDDGNPATPAAVFAIPTAINDNNLIVGASEPSAGAVLNSVWWEVDANGTVTAADEPLAPLAVNQFSAALALNLDGNVAGIAANATGAIRAVLWADVNAVPAALPLLTPGGETMAYGINDSGRIVGEAENTNGFLRAVWWQQSDTGTAGPFVLPGVPNEWDSIAYAVNNGNVVAGELIDFDGISHAAVWLWDGSAYSLLNLPDGGFDHSVALALNNADPLIVAGEVSDDGLTAEIRAVRWSIAGNVATLTDLGTNNIDSGAEAVNDAGLVAGWRNDRATVWSGTTATDLFTTSSQAFDINNNNLAVGRLGSQGFVKRFN